MKQCAVCDKDLTGRQKRFCSTYCKNRLSNNKHQNYLAQQKRGLRRRLKLIDLSGGSCNVCGYNKNISALSFHHIDPSQKSFQLDLRRCSNNRWDKLVEEMHKCKLLCLNCHAEEHNPTLIIESLRLSS